jgi:hypothetical protein
VQRTCTCQQRRENRSRPISTFGATREAGFKPVVERSRVFLLRSKDFFKPKTIC